MICSMLIMNMPIWITVYLQNKWCLNLESYMLFLIYRLQRVDYGETNDTTCLVLGLPKFVRQISQGNDQELRPQAGFFKGQDSDALIELEITIIHSSCGSVYIYLMCGNSVTIVATDVAAWSNAISLSRSSSQLSNYLIKSPKVFNIKRCVPWR